MPVFFALTALVGCGETDPSPGSITGPVQDVTVGNGAVTAFDLETDGPPARVLIDEQRDYGFDLEHLHEHVATGDPVVVETEERDGRLVAISIEDV